MGKIVLYLMMKKGFAAFSQAIEIDREIIDFIVIDKDANVDNDFSKEITELAVKSRIRFYIRGEEPEVDRNTYILAISWRWMINHPAQRLVIFHDSLLPKYKGFAPLVNMLINGGKKIGVSAIFGAEEYDRGDLIAQNFSNIQYPITISEAIDINIKNLNRLVKEVISNISSEENLIGTSQREHEATYSIWRDDDDYRIDWGKSADEIKRLIDAVGTPYLGARTSTCNAETIRIIAAEVVNDVKCEMRHVGKVLFIREGLPTVICGRGLLQINEAYYDKSANKSYLPLKSFRVRFL